MICCGRTGCATARLVCTVCSFVWRVSSYGSPEHTLCATSGPVLVSRNHRTYVLLSRATLGYLMTYDSQPSSDRLTMPEDSVNLWSWSTFSFVEPLFKVSNSRTVNDSDVWTLSPFFTHKNIFTKYLHYISE